MDEPTLFCPQCDYNLTGLTKNRCPECGLAFDPEALATDLETWPKPITWTTAIFLLSVAPVLVMASASVIAVTHWTALYTLIGISWALGLIPAYVVAVRVLTSLNRRSGGSSHRRVRDGARVLLAGLLFAIQSLVTLALLTVARFI